MNKIHLINTITQERKVLINQASYGPPWKVERIEYVKNPGEPGGMDNEHTRATKARIAVWLQKSGLPVAEFYDAMRWVLKKDCPFCQMGTQVLKAIDELGEDKVEEALEEILKAKDANDMARLEQIKKDLWQSERPTSRT